MSDDQHRPPDNPVTPSEGGNDDAAPSTIFVELMREAAAKRAERMEKRDMYRRPRVERVRPEAADDDESDDTTPADQPAHQSTPLRPTSASLSGGAPSRTPDQRAPKTAPPTEQDDTSLPDTSVPDAPSDAPSASESSPEPEQTMPTYYDLLFEEIEPADTQKPIEPPAPLRPPESIVQQTAHPSIPIYEPPSQEELERSAKLEEQRIRRVHRRQERRRQRRAGLMGGFIYTLLIVGIAACIGSTIFTWFTDPQFFNAAVVTGLQVASEDLEATHAPTSMPTPNWYRRVGIVSGHRGPEDDPGAVCDDGLTEAEINFNVATRVVRNLRDMGYSVDLLDEFDTRLDNYQAAALVSIHSNDCTDYGEVVTGYLVAKAAARAEGGPDTRLAECLAQYYGQATGLRRGESLTIDMTDYHSFREIHPLTPAAILELGFMRADRDLLTQQPDLLAQGITQGIVCFLNPNNTNPAQSQDTAEDTAATPDAASDEGVPLDAAEAAEAAPIEPTAAP